MARKIIRNQSLILQLDDYEIVKEVCETIAETSPGIADDAMSLWICHNRHKVPEWY